MTPEHRDNERRSDPPPTGSEYEAYKEAVEKRAILGFLILIGMLLLLCLNAYGTFIKNPQDRQHGDETFRLSQFQGCVQSGNLLRIQMRDEFVDLKRTTIIPLERQLRDVFQSFADLTPPDQRDLPGYEIITNAVEKFDQNVDYLHQRIERIDDRIPLLDCFERYPPLEGQSYPPDLVREAEQQLGS